MLVFGLLISLLEPLFSFEEGMTGSKVIFAVITIFAVAVIGVVVQMVSQYATTKAVVDTDSAQPASFKELYKFGFKIFFPAIWISILFNLILFGTAVFLIVPAIVVGIYLSFFSFVLVDQNKRGLAALTHSFYYVRDNFWKVLGRLLALAFLTVLAGLVVAGIILLVVFLSDSSYFSMESFINLAPYLSSGSSVWSVLSSLIYGFILYCFYVPLLNIYYYQIYKHLKVSKPVPNPETDLKKTHSWFLGFSIFGLVVSVVVFILLLIVPFAFAVISGFNGAKERAMRMQQPLPVAVEEARDLSIATNPSLLESPARGGENFGYSIQIPKGWTLFVDPEDQDQGAVISLPDDNNNAVIQIQKVPLELSSDELAMQVFRGILENNPDLQNPITGKVNIGTESVYKMWFEDNSADRGLEYHLMPDGKETFSITIGWSEYSKAENVESLLKDSVSTFKNLP